MLTPAQKEILFQAFRLIFQLGTVLVVVFLTHSYIVMSVIIAGTPRPRQSSGLAVLRCAASGGLTDDGAQNHSGAIP